MLSRVILYHTGCSALSPLDFVSHGRIPKIENSRQISHSPQYRSRGVRSSHVLRLTSMTDSNTTRLQIQNSRRVEPARWKTFFSNCPSDERQNTTFFLEALTQHQHQHQRLCIERRIVVSVDHGGNRIEPTQPVCQQDDATKAAAKMPSTSRVAHAPVDSGSDDVPCECWEQSPQTVVVLGKHKRITTFR